MNMSSVTQAKYANFEDFYDALDAERHITEKLTDHPGIGDQLRESIRKLYERIQIDSDFENRLAASPQDTALEFFRDEISHYTLSDDDLDVVAGGKITLDSTLGYDIGYVIGSAAEFVADFFD